MSTSATTSRRPQPGWRWHRLLHGQAAKLPGHDGRDGQGGLPHCTSHRVLASYLGDTLRNKNYSEIVLTLSETVLVTSTSYPEFRLGVALAEVGGAMGLWLGLGVLQILESLARGLAAGAGG